MTHRRRQKDGNQEPAIGAADVEKHLQSPWIISSIQLLQGEFLPARPARHCNTRGGSSDESHSRLPSRRRSPGPVTARAGRRASDTRFTGSPTYPPGQNGKLGTGAQPALQGHPSTGDLPELGSPRGASDEVRVWRWRSAPQFLARHSPGGGLAGLSTVTFSSLLSPIGRSLSVEPFVGILVRIGLDFL